MSLLDRENLNKERESRFIPRSSRITPVPEEEKTVSDKLEIKKRKPYHIDPYFRYTEKSLTLSETRKKYKYPINLYYYIYEDRYTPEYIKEKIESIPNHEEFLKESISKCFQSTDPDKAYDAILLIFNTNEKLNVIKKEVGISDLNLMISIAADYIKFYLYETITGKHYDMMHTGLDKYIIEALRRYNIYSFSDLEKELENLYEIDGLGLKGLTDIRNNEVIKKVIGEDKIWLIRKSKNRLLDPNISISQEELNELINKTYDSYPVIMSYYGSDPMYEKEHSYLTKTIIKYDIIFVYVQGFTKPLLYKDMDDFINSWEIHNPKKKFSQTPIEFD